MAYFSWTNDLVTGNTFIDNDHRKLVDMVNALYDALADGRAKDVMGKVLNNLIIYTKEHFAREEAEMQRIKYQKYLAHKLEHDKLIKEAEQLKSAFESGATINPVQVGKMLSDWLKTHIMQIDTQLAVALREAK